jgi:hypothetical protein
MTTIVWLEHFNGSWWLSLDRRDWMSIAGDTASALEEARVLFPRAMVVVTAAENASVA